MLLCSQWTVVSVDVRLAGYKYTIAMLTKLKLAFCCNKQNVTIDFQQIECGLVHTLNLITAAVQRTSTIEMR
jgi:hypothetical protein